MVDEYDMSKKIQVTFEDVQIPLWSMNTMNLPKNSLSVCQFRFLYGRWILAAYITKYISKDSSDSSMVDEYYNN